MKIGTDLQSLAEVKSKLGLLTNRAVFTDYERSYMQGKPDPSATLGGIFTAKEACIKALSGYADAPKITFIDLEIQHEPSGRPLLRPGRRLAPWMRDAGVSLDLTISHSADYVVATVIATRTTGAHDAREQSDERGTRRRGTGRRTATRHERASVLGPLDGEDRAVPSERRHRRRERPQDGRRRRGVTA
jgi:phosphopantetheine--protein transferase-like protein